MTVIQVTCTKCGCDRFVSSTTTSRDETVASIQCEECSTMISVDDVVWYQEDFMSAKRRSLEDGDSFNSAFYLIPGS
ncbi:hypothetical protein [Candidatus Pantoea floridensis]|uniref:Uncharacterized protein n=1 Tax=Candidatus Pantoea floridensis TaxID=1938870 RepID=A0A286DR49_9GAMM|nr:hypothetical protein [Pantoea floridensis]PIF07581.1 hypothetical protein BX596_5099 [Enterobacteriaceae bacterium JKS000233]SOD61111.1 hypothetical protein SAMN06273570_4946 [Pantoea floridensis]